MALEVDDPESTMTPEEQADAIDRADIIVRYPLRVATLATAGTEQPGPSP